jgi:hypothetical protein
VNGSTGCSSGSNVSGFCWRSISFIAFNPESERGEILRFVSPFSVAIAAGICGSLGVSFSVDSTSTTG